MSIKIGFLVVLYNCSVDKSVTVQRLLESAKLYKNLKILIWNNGPASILSSNSNVISDSYRVIETLDNLPLSNIYNEFLREKYDRYVILDQDSDISDEYMDEVLNNTYITYLGIPKLTHNNLCISPCLNHKFPVIKIKSSSKIFAAGSGLVLTSELINDFNEEFGTVFDENYRLYGVDYSLFYRLQKLKKVHKLTIIKGFSHSFSKFESETVATKLFRQQQRSIDLGITIRRYPSWFSVRLFIIQLMLFFLKKNSLDISTIVRHIMSGSYKI